MPADTRLPLVVIVGPTAAGKTEVAIQLAGRLDGEIVSADSRLFYRGMDIGTAKPTPEQRRLVAHHLIDIAAPDEPWSLATFQNAARQAIAAIHERRHLPFLVGGTGQYIHAVIEAWQVPAVEPQPAMRQALERWAQQITAEGLHARLAVLDPEAATRIDPRNLRRTVRALEVILSTGRPFSGQRKRMPSPSYRTLTLGLNRPRQELYARIDARIQAMLDAGLVDEVRNLLNRGYSPELPPLSAIGYQEIANYLLGKTSLDEAVAQMKRKTRIYVRRQSNWFKRDDTDILWFEVGPGTLDKIGAVINAWLRQVP
jgi:tRNA dimethylallyltransferase